MSTTTTTAAGLSMTDVRLVLGQGDTAVTALDNITLDVPPGTVLAVIGPSGAGKSSLLAVAGGLRQPDSGTVRIGGVETAGLRDRHLARLRRDHVGYVFQQSNLFAALTILEQLLLRTHLRNRPTSTDHARAEDLLTAVGLQHRASHRPHQLSGGERQRAGLARALMTEPSVLLIDEPTSALDRRRSAEIGQLIATETRRRGCATVIVTHDRDILEYADQTRELTDGRLN
jgi:putative ABC transport system ATP-binding protein